MWTLIKVVLTICLVVSLALVSGYRASTGARSCARSFTGRQAFSGTQQSFNPFSSRTRNKNIQWFEADLETFYRFVEQQPLLTNEQEIQYGKALRMWQKTEQLREKMQNMREEQDLALRGCGSDGGEAVSAMTTMGMDGFEDGEGVKLVEAATPTPTLPRQKIWTQKGVEQASGSQPTICRE